jgi:hypothetical protein
MNGKYIFNKATGKTRLVSSPTEWAKAFEDKDNNRIGLDYLTKEVCVSTVFLGLDHNFGGGGPPLLFETMVFSEDERVKDQACWRYATMAKAVEGHKKICEDTKALLGMSNPKQLSKQLTMWPVDE